MNRRSEPSSRSYHILPSLSIRSLVHLTCSFRLCIPPPAVLFDAILFTRPDRGLSWPLVAQTFHWFLSGHGYMLCAQGAFRDALSYDPLSPMHCSHDQPCFSTGRGDNFNEADGNSDENAAAAPHLSVPLRVSGHMVDTVLSCPDCRSLWRAERAQKNSAQSQTSAPQHGEASTDAAAAAMPHPPAVDPIDIVAVSGGPALPLCSRHTHYTADFMRTAAVQTAAAHAARGRIDIDSLPLSMPLTSPFSSPCLAVPSREDCLLMLEMLSLARLRRNLEMDRRFQNLCTNARRQLATSRGTTSLTIHNALAARKRKHNAELQPDTLISCALGILNQSPYACPGAAAPPATPNARTTLTSLEHPLTCTAMLATAVASVLGLSLSHLPALNAHLTPALWRYIAPMNLRNWRRLLTTIDTEQRLKQSDGSHKHGGIKSSDGQQPLDMSDSTTSRKDRARASTGSAQSMAFPAEPTDEDVGAQCVADVVLPAHSLQASLRDFHAHDAKDAMLSGAATPALNWGFLALMMDQVVKVCTEHALSSPMSITSSFISSTHVLYIF